MAYPGYYLANASPISVTSFGVGERPGSTLRGKISTVAQEHTDLVFETEEGVLWVYPQVRRGIWRLVFRVTELQLAVFQTLHTLVDGQRIPFYFVPDTADPNTVYLVRKEKDFNPQQIDIPTYIGGVIVPIYDYVLEMREESAAAQLAT